jgi:Fe-S-cluster-containing hydrogenase component 2
VNIRRKTIEIDEGRCTGCGQCASACAEGALIMIGGKARLVSESFCDGLGACLGECPEGALRIVEREAEEFDAEAAHEHLAAEAGTAAEIAKAGQRNAKRTDSRSGIRDFARGESALGHWPVQIRLIPPNAPFLKNADLLVAADCTPLAYAGFHTNLLTGRAVMLGCPKFDDAEAYAAKFAEIFRADNIRRITVVQMEVPCCARLSLIVRAALAASGKEIPFEEIVVSRKGELTRK